VNPVDFSWRWSGALRPGKFDPPQPCWGPARRRREPRRRSGSTTVFVSRLSLRAQCPLRGAARIRLRLFHSVPLVLFAGLNHPATPAPRSERCAAGRSLTSAGSFGSTRHPGRPRFALDELGRGLHRSCHYPSQLSCGDRSAWRTVPGCAQRLRRWCLVGPTERPPGTWTRARRGDTFPRLRGLASAFSSVILVTAPGAYASSLSDRAPCA